MAFSEVMEYVTRGFEVVGVVVLVVGGIGALLRAARSGKRGGDFYETLRREFGHALLLGLEILVAADIVKTVSVDSSLESVLILGVLVIVRTLLSVSLDAEIDGVLPWRRRQLEHQLADSATTNNNTTTGPATAAGGPAAD
jgi:uncharacterized membrane protein